tara:strand:- start:2199 stop:3302 length:1104 start_codon:yes stop_codon:yes gene_type:complete
MKVHFDFPREVLELSTEKGKGFRKLVADTNEFERYWAGKNGVSNAYMTVYGYRGTNPPYHKRVDLQTPIIRHFVLDIDPKNFKAKDRHAVEPQETLDQTRRLHEFLLKENIEHGVWYSGGGFHIWVALDKPYIPSSGAQVSAVKEAGMTVVNDWIHQLDLFCSDPAVPFDTSGLIRIPNSYNAKRGYWSIPLTSEEITHNDIWSIMELAMSPRSGKFTYGELGVELDVKKPSERKAVFNHDSPVMDIPTISMNGVKILPCLNAAACQVGGNPSHDARVQLVKYLAKRLRNFYPLDRVNQEDVMKHTEQIVEFIKTLEWADFNEGVTRYQVSTIMNKDYPQTCSMLFKKGHCVGKCRYWDKTGAIGDA